WFMGYTAQLTGGVWVGNDNGKPMNRATGGSLPADIWRQVMRVAHDGLPPLLLPGTVAASPEADAAVWGAQALSAHPPRVIEAKEKLPVPSAQDADARPFHASAFAAGARASHPTNGIDENFIEKAIAATEGDSAKSPAPGVPEASTAQSGSAVPSHTWW
ncbi:MAG: penicillin-binding protein, partial [Hyphomicrobium sp.]